MKNIRELEKERKINLIEEFYEENRRLPKQSEKAKDETAIGTFLSSIKQKKTVIKKEQYERLKKIGFSMETGNFVKTDVEYRIKLVEEFYKKNGRLPCYKEVSENGSKIGSFIINVKRKHIRITEDQKIRLEQLGLQIGETIANKKEKKINLIEEFYEENGRLPKQSEKAKDGTAIGTFLKSIKQKNITINEEQLERLKRIGFRMSIQRKMATKMEMVQLIEKLKKERDLLLNQTEMEESKKLIK